MTSIIPQAKLLNMKLLMKLTMLLLLFGVSATAALAQYDDVYYDPERNNNRTYTERRQVQPKTTPAQTEEYTYDENYDDEEYDYYYTSRIRRFHRPYAGFNYFDPIYVDAYYYDAFARPGVTVLIYDDPFGYYSFNRFNRFNRWNGWAYGGWNRYNRWNSWNNWNSYDPFWGWSNPGLSFGFGWNSFNRWNNWNSFGYGGPYWGNSWFNTPSWGNNYYYNNINYYNNNQNNDNNRNVYYGPRTGGGGVGTQPGIDNPNGRSPRFTDSDIKSNPGTVRPDYSGGRKLDEATSYDRDRTVPGNGNPRVTTTDPNREVLGTPNNTDRYRDARENLNRPSNETRRPETADPFSGGRRIDNGNNGARTYTDDRQNLRPNTTQDPYNSRPRSYEPAPRSTDNSSLDRSRTYTPDRSYERSRSTDTYSAPRNSSPSNSGSGYSRPNYDSGRSSGYGNSGGGFNSAPRSFDGGGSRPSAGGSNPSPSSSGSSGSSSSGGRSSSSGGRQN